MVAAVKLRASASASAFTFGVSHASLVRAPPKQQGRSRKRRLPTETAGDSDSASTACDSDQSEADLKQSLAEQVAGSSSDSSGVSVDTDADEDVDEVPSRASVAAQAGAARHFADVGDDGARDGALRQAVVDSGSDADGAEAPDGGEGAAGPEREPSSRHAPGTWKVFGSAWFYITNSPGYPDVKIYIKNSLRKDEDGGMGRKAMSKTLSVHHFGDQKENPVKTMLLLRAWSFWRCRQNGWVDAKPARGRELARELRRFRQDLVGELPDAPTRPLWGNAVAQSLMEKWVPDIVKEVLP